MAISDKTRKSLWGRSGNRCAFCRRELVINGTQVDDESIVGEECHIISGKLNGPRYRPEFLAANIDEAANLILLCRVHHKMVDDQSETYTVEELKELRFNHERWVSVSLSEEKHMPPVRIRRIKANIPSHLLRLISGDDVFSVLDGAMAFQFDHDELDSETEVDLLSGFFQEAQDWGDISSEMEAGERVKAKYRISWIVKDLERSGFLLFGAREVQRVEGGVGAPCSFPIAIIRAVRSTSPEILKVNSSNATGTEL
jgi:hypothetical protein